MRAVHISLCDGRWAVTIHTYLSSFKQTAFEAALEYAHRRNIKEGRYAV